MMRPSRTVYYVQPTDTYTYDAQDAADEAFKAAYSVARNHSAELTCTNALPGHTTYVVYFPRTRSRQEFRVISESDGIEL